MIDEEPKSRAPLILAVGLVAAALIVGGVYLAGRLSPSSAPAPQQAPPMGPAEQAYVPQIQFLEPKVTRAANFLNQDVTFVWGTVANNGSRPVKQIEITLEFQDPFKQVVLRDKQLLFTPTSAPLAPKEQRDFQIDYESIPVEWNQAYPVIRITGLQLQ